MADRPEENLGRMASRELSARFFSRMPRRLVRPRSRTVAR